MRLSGISNIQNKGKKEWLYVKKLVGIKGCFCSRNIFSYWMIIMSPQFSQYTKLTHDNFWGSENIAIDGSALQDQQINISSGTIVFKSGTLVEIGKNSILVPRSFIDSWGNRSQPLKNLSRREKNKPLCPQCHHIEKLA